MDDDRLNQIQNRSGMVFDSLNQIISKQSDIRRVNLSQKRTKVKTQESLLSGNSTQGGSRFVVRANIKQTPSLLLYDHPLPRRPRLLKELSPARLLPILLRTRPVGYEFGHQTKKQVMCSLISFSDT